MDQVNNIINGKPVQVQVAIDAKAALYLGSAIFLAIALGIVLGNLVKS